MKLIGKELKKRYGTRYVVQRMIDDCVLMFDSEDSGDHLAGYRRLPKYEVVEELNLDSHHGFVSDYSTRVPAGESLLYAIELAQRKVQEEANEILSKVEEVESDLISRLKFIAHSFGLLSKKQRRFIDQWKCNKETLRLYANGSKTIDVPQTLIDSLHVYDVRGWKSPSYIDEDRFWSVDWDNAEEDGIVIYGKKVLDVKVRDNRFNKYRYNSSHWDFELFYQIPLYGNDRTGGTTTIELDDEGKIYPRMLKEKVFLTEHEAIEFAKAKRLELVNNLQAVRRR